MSRMVLGGVNHVQPKKPSAGTESASEALDNC
jgi:hypothetical protein